ncbi:MAG: hypothetical protein Q8M34_02410 [Thermodesulfovibrionales bacterium]|nr:hypothetical protein [Thermodesulfovibrionales bacterium]
MFNKKIAYFDPNTFGEKGYSMIGPLLLFYEKVVLYGPVGYLIEKSYDNKELNKTSLTPDEFVEYIKRGLIIPLGFETFFNEDTRAQLYLPELRVTTDFDRDLISSPTLSKKKVIVPNDFKFKESPHKAKELIDSNQVIKNKLLAEIKRESSLPKRYIDLKENVDQIPNHLREIIRINNPESLLPYVVVYDLLNNRYVMDYEGSAEIHSQHGEFRELYRAIHGLEKNTNETKETIEILTEILSTCVSKISYDRLTSEQIDEFRIKHRKYFISFVEFAFKLFSEETDFYKKKEKILELLGEKFGNINIHLAIGPEKLIEMVPSLSVISKPISTIFYSRPGTKRNKLYHYLRQPFVKSDRWIYHFLKTKK